jgi:hypothetical protein
MYRFNRRGVDVMSIKMPQVIKAICDNCRTIQEVNWSSWGSLNSCENCDAAPICLTPTLKTKKEGK